MQKGFLYIFFIHTDFFPKTLIFHVIYTDFVLDQSGRFDDANCRLVKFMKMHKFYTC